SRGEPSPLAKLPVQYADYALWQRSWLQGAELERQLAYWRERLGGSPGALELPTDRPRPAVASFRGAKIYFGFSKELTEGLLQLARGEQATLFMVLLAAFQALLYRLSGQSDVLVGSPIAGRTHRQTEGLIGFFVNTLVLRTQVRAAESFRELLGRVKETALGAYAHQDLPFEKLVAELQPERDLSRHPLFQVVLTLINVPREELSLPGLRLTRMPFPQAAPKFDLTFNLFESPAGLQGSIEYASDLFDVETIARLASHLQRLLEGSVADPDCAIERLPLVSDEEREDVLHRRNATQ